MDYIQSHDDQDLVNAIQKAAHIDGVLLLRPDACPACKSTETWASEHRSGICRTCHPPVPGAELHRA